MQFSIYRPLARLFLAVLRWEEKGLVSKNAANRDYILDIDERCNGGSLMHDGMVGDYIEARECLNAGEIALQNLRVRIQLLENKLNRAGQQA